VRLEVENRPLQSSFKEVLHVLARGRWNGRSLTSALCEYGIYGMGNTRTTNHTVAWPLVNEEFVVNEVSCFEQVQRRQSGDISYEASAMHANCEFETRLEDNKGFILEYTRDSKAHFARLLECCDMTIFVMKVS
jgi:hypothetical protein